MATPDLTSGQVMNQAAALLNDSAKSIYTYPVQLPYLNMALQELQELFELNEVAVTDTVSAIITIPAQTANIGFATVPALPSNLIEPQILWERTQGVDPFVPMTPLDFIPQYLYDIQISQLVYWVWQNQQINFIPAISNNDIKMDYIRNLFGTFSDVTGNDQVAVINAASYLEYKTAALMARFIAENPTRADSLDGEAVLAMDRALGIGSKGRQKIISRRRPFRSSWKQRQFM